jgi:hypothetical protein
MRVVPDISYVRRVQCEVSVDSSIVSLLKAVSGLQMDQAATTSSLLSMCMCTRKVSLALSRWRLCHTVLSWFLRILVEMSIQTCHFIIITVCDFNLELNLFR